MLHIRNIRFIYSAIKTRISVNSKLHLINEQLYEWYTQWSLKDWFTYNVYFEWLWPYIMTLSKLCLKGISLLSYLCGIWLTSLKKKNQLLKQNVIIIGATIKSPKLRMTLIGIGLTFTRNGLEVGISMVFEIFGHFLFQGMKPPSNVMKYTIWCSLT
jgi:hypothetical protein